MNIEIKGTVIHAEPPKEFGSTGFIKSIIVVETDEEYKQSLAIEFFKDKAQKAYDEMQLGDSVVVSADLRGKEYNGRYYNSISGWRWQVCERGY